MNNGRQNETGKYIGKYMILVHESVMEAYTSYKSDILKV